MGAKYGVIISWSKEDGCYLAEVPEPKGRLQLRRLNIFCFEIIRNLKTLRRFGKEAGNFFFALRIKELLDGTKR